MHLKCPQQLAAGHFSEQGGITGPLPASAQHGGQDTSPMGPSIPTGVHSSQGEDGHDVCLNECGSRPGSTAVALGQGASGWIWPGG